MIIIILDGERQTDVSSPRTHAADSISSWRTRRHQIGFDIMANYTALEIAKYIVAYCSKRQLLVSNIKLQKLLYLVFGEYYAETGTALFQDPFQAWQYGPVVASVYSKFAIYGGSYICLMPNDIAAIDKISQSTNDRSIIDKTLDRYIEKAPLELVELVRTPGKAWSRVVASNGGLEGPPDISHAEIFEDFKKK